MTPRSKYSGILFRLKQILPCETLFSLYNTLVLPHLFYCNLVWADSNNKNLAAIHIKQKRIIRLCSNSHWLAHSPPLFKNFNTLTIYDIHKLLKGLFMYNYTKNNLPRNFYNYFVLNRAIHSYSTRISNMYRPYNFICDLARNTIKREGPLLWNSIDVELRNAPSQYVFKRKYKLHLLSSYNWFASSQLYLIFCITGYIYVNSTINTVLFSLHLYIVFKLISWQPSWCQRSKFVCLHLSRWSLSCTLFCTVILFVACMHV